MYTVEYYLALKRKEILTHATMWVNLESIVLSKITTHKRTNALCFQLYEAVEQSNSQRHKVKWWFPEAGEGGNGELVFEVYRVSVWEDGKSSGDGSW